MSPRGVTVNDANASTEVMPVEATLPDAVDVSEPMPPADVVAPAPPRPADVVLSAEPMPPVGVVTSVALFPPADFAAPAPAPPWLALDPPAARNPPTPADDPPTELAPSLPPEGVIVGWMQPAEAM